MRSVDRNTEKRFMEKEWEVNIKRNFDGTAGPWLVDTPQNQQTGKIQAFKSVFKKNNQTFFGCKGSYKSVMVESSDSRPPGNTFDKFLLKLRQRLLTCYGIKSKGYEMRQELHLKYVDRHT
jgi:hypothetical protein